MYTKIDHFPVAVDNVIFGFDGESLNVLLFERQVEPERGKWSLIGSFVKKDENAEAAASRILEDYTGLRNIAVSQLKTYSNIDRDPGGRVISIAYYAMLRISEIHTDLLKKYHAKWHKLTEPLALAVDHDLMLEDALSKIREDAKNSPVAFQLLPDKFTLLQLQKVYEVIYGLKIDVRNFRKKILSTKFLIALDEKDKTTSRKGSILYQIDHEKIGRSQQGGEFFNPRNG